jgi:cytidine deaminase
MKAMKEAKRSGSAKPETRPRLTLLKGAKRPSSARPAPKTPAALLDAAREVATHAYAPYSKFKVGAAVETSDGRTFVGANMENASYGVTMCAEVGALQAASSAGALDKIRRIAIVGGPAKPAAGYRPKPTAPCGRCRQLISEAAMHGGHEIEVWYGDLDGKVVERRTISELLPDAFDSGNLK